MSIQASRLVSTIRLLIAHERRLFVVKSDGCRVVQSAVRHLASVPHQAVRNCDYEQDADSDTARDDVWQVRLDLLRKRLAASIRVRVRH